MRAARDIRRQRADDIAHMRVDGVKIDSDALGLDAKGLAATERIDALRCSDQRLCRYAGAVEALAAHAAFFDQHRWYVARRRSRRDGKAAGA